MLDATDRRILRQLQADPTQSRPDLAERAGLNAATCWRRLDKTAPRAFEEFAGAARQIPEVLEIQTFLGQVDVRLGLIARDLAHYQTLYRERILTLPHIADLEALMHVARIKTDETVPL